MNRPRTAEYRIAAKDGDGMHRYCFLCGVTGARFCTASAYQSDDPDRELLLAWEAEGRSHFNQCRKCGRWVVDAAFNPEVLECVECAPFEDTARFCKSCGVRVPAQSRKCPVCGKSLYYEGVDPHDPKAQI